MSFPRWLFHLELNKNEVKLLIFGCFYRLLHPCACGARTGG